MYPNNDYRNYLMHHGILGQKWGVRRYQNPDGSLKQSGKDRYSKGKRIAKRIAIGLGITAGVLLAAGVTASAIKGKPKIIDSVKSSISKTSVSKIKNSFSSKKVSSLSSLDLAKQKVAKLDADSEIRKGKNWFIQLANKPLSEISGEKEKIAKGKDIFRITQLKENEVSENIRDRTMLYINSKKEDSERYKFLLGKFTEGQRSSLTYKTTKELSMPSERQRLITFMGLVNSNPIFKGVLERDIGQVVDPSKSRQYYTNFFATVPRNSASAQIFFNELKSRGFDAMPDDLDRGWLSKSATIIFDPKNKIKIKNVERLTQKDFIKAAMNIKMWNQY